MFFRKASGRLAEALKCNLACKRRRRLRPQRLAQEPARPTRAGLGGAAYGYYLLSLRFTTGARLPLKRLSLFTPLVEPSCSAFTS